MDPPLAGSKPRLRLRLLSITDLHANLYPYDYYRDCPDDLVGLARAASLVAEARSEALNCLLFDNGDVLQGTLLGDLAAEAIIADARADHPVIAAMNTLDYAVATLGNHDFNYGLETLERAYGQARFPVVCCNVRKSDGSPWFPPSIVVERALVEESETTHQLKVGVIGVAPPQIAQWDEAQIRGRLITRDIVESVSAELGELRGRVDLVIVLCHSGISRLASTREKRMRARTSPSLRALTRYYLAISTCCFLARILPNCGALTRSAEGSMASRRSWRVSAAAISGSLILSLRWTGLGGSRKRRLKSGQSRGATLIIARLPLSNWTVCVLEAAKTAHEATLRHIRTTIGRLATRLDSYFALIGDNAIVRLINEAQRDYAAPIAASRPDLASLPMLSAASPFKCGGRSGPYSYTDIAAGPLAIKDVADIYPYPNSLRVVKVDGATLKEWLERSASIFRVIDPNQRGEQPLLGPAFAATIST